MNYKYQVEAPEEETPEENTEKSTEDTPSE